MKLLGWDTSAKTGALVALEWTDRDKLGWEGVRVVGEWSLNVSAVHSERLLWAAHTLLEAVQWKLEEVDLLAVGVGPGSFTGLRIGLTTARTLAHLLRKPLIPVSSLAALARPLARALADLRDGPVIAIAATDACKGELFAIWGAAAAVADCVIMAEGDRPGLWKRGVEEAVLTPDALVKAVRKKLAASPRARWVAIGEGRARYPEAWAQLPRARELAAGEAFPAHVQGRWLGQLAWEAFQSGLARADSLDVHPRYLRASDAELKLKAGLLKPSPTTPAKPGPRSGEA